MSSKQNDDILTLGELADFLKIHYQTARELVHNGKIPAAQMGRNYKILRSDALEYVEKLKQERMEKLRKGKN